MLKLFKQSKYMVFRSLRGIILK